MKKVILEGVYGAQPTLPAADQLSYYLTYRPTSPVVICPILSLVGLFGLFVVAVVVAAGISGRRRPDDDDDLI